MARFSQSPSFRADTPPSDLYPSTPDGFRSPDLDGLDVLPFDRHATPNADLHNLDGRDALPFERHASPNADLFTGSHGRARRPGLSPFPTQLYGLMGIRLEGTGSQPASPAAIEPDIASAARDSDGGAGERNISSVAPIDPDALVFTPARANTTTSWEMARDACQVKQGSSKAHATWEDAVAAYRRSYDADLIRIREKPEPDSGSPMRKRHRAVVSSPSSPTPQRPRFTSPEAGSYLGVGTSTATSGPPPPTPAMSGPHPYFASSVSTPPRHAPARPSIPVTPGAAANPIFVNSASPMSRRHRPPTTHGTPTPSSRVPESSAALAGPSSRVAGPSSRAAGPSSHVAGSSSAGSNKPFAPNQDRRHRRLCNTGIDGDPIVVDESTHFSSIPIVPWPPKPPAGHRSAKIESRISASSSSAYTRVVHRFFEPVTPEQAPSAASATNETTDAVISPLQHLAQVRRGDGAEPGTPVAGPSQASSSQASPSIGSDSFSLLANHGSDEDEDDIEIDDDLLYFEFNDSGLASSPSYSINPSTSFTTTGAEFFWNVLWYTPLETHSIGLSVTSLRFSVHFFPPFFVLCATR
ncbi:hypothetical protein BJ912DRAFT_1054809 [Pholiota molesta]|nr:hypothetical protein BJ912DRAFT_1054809 [Pholiota molesta]